MKRFFLNEYVSYFVFYLALLPAIYESFASHGNSFMNVCYLFAIMTSVAVSIDRKSPSKEDGNVPRRKKNRYFLLFGLLFLSNILYCLFDYYLYEIDNVMQSVLVNIFSIALCTPIAIVRTVHSYKLDHIEYEESMRLNYDEDSSMWRFIWFTVCVVVSVFAEVAIMAYSGFFTETSDTSTCIALVGIAVLFWIIVYIVYYSIFDRDD